LDAGRVAVGVEVFGFEDDFRAGLTFPSERHETEAVWQLLGFGLRSEVRVVVLDGRAHLAQFLLDVPDVIHVASSGKLVAFGVQNVFEYLFDVDAADVHEFDCVRQFLGLEHGHA